MLELKQIKDLMNAMGRFGVQRSSLKEGEFELELETESKRNCPSFAQHPRGDIPKALHPPVDSHKGLKTDGGLYITSPMVGTFYGASSPEDPPFVEVGDLVTKETVVCIVEAMKVMNEVKSGQKGKIVEVLVEAGHPVEYGTKLFRLSSSS